MLSIAWSYPLEVIPPHNTMIPNILNWIGLSIVTIVPPLVVGAMPNNNAYQLFILFGDLWACCIHSDLYDNGRIQGTYIRTDCFQVFVFHIHKFFMNVSFIFKLSSLYLFEDFIDFILVVHLS